MQKDDSILYLLRELDVLFGPGNIIIKDFWEADLCAIGISSAHSKKLIYISTYSKDPGNYYINVESDMNMPGKSEIVIDNADISFLSDLISRHFGLEKL